MWGCGPADLWPKARPGPRPELARDNPVYDVGLPRRMDSVVTPIRCPRTAVPGLLGDLQLQREASS
jgi:hypothetical protein